MAIRRVRESFAFTNSHGVPIVMNAGDLVEVDNFDGYKGREHLFEDVESYVSRTNTAANSPVEKATADPGEKRNVNVPGLRRKD